MNEQDIQEAWERYADIERMSHGDITGKPAFYAAVEWVRSCQAAGDTNDTFLTDLLTERGKRYGEFEDHAFISQGLKEEMSSHKGWSRLKWDQKEALEMIAHKVARILNGDPHYSDSWVDIAGYAKLVADRLVLREAE